MNISEHHRSRLEELELEVGGIENLSLLFYKINLYSNTWNLCKEFNIEMYKIRYLMNFEASKCCQCYIYERTHYQQLTLVYHNGVKMVA